VGDSVVFARLRQCAPPCNTCFLWFTRAHNENGISIDSAVFAQLTAAECGGPCPGMPFPLKTAPPHGDLDTHLTRFLGASLAHNPNGISIGSAVFAGFTTDRPRDHERPRYSVCNNRPHLVSKKDTTQPPTIISTITVRLQ